MAIPVKTSGADPHLDGTIWRRQSVEIGVASDILVDTLTQCGEGMGTMIKALRPDAVASQGHHEAPHVAVALSRRTLGYLSVRL